MAIEFKQAINTNAWLTKICPFITYAQAINMTSWSIFNCMQIIENGLQLN